MTRTAVLAGTFLFALTLSIIGQEPEPKAGLHKTPQAVFDAFWKAVQKQDFKTALACLTPESLNQTIGHIARDTMEMRQRGSVGFRFDKDKGETDEESKKKLKPIADILDKHGLTEKVAKEFMEAGKGKDGKELKKLQAELLKRLKNPEGFALEMINAMSKVDPNKVKGPKEQKMKLVDVKIDGDKATGSIAEAHDIKTKDGGKQETREFKRPVEFQRIKGGWRINPNPEREYGSGPKVEIKDKDVKKDGAVKDR